jgi:hypothetical protein
MSWITRRRLINPSRKSSTVDKTLRPNDSRISVLPEERLLA